MGVFPLTSVGVEARPTHSYTERSLNYTKEEREEYTLKTKQEPNPEKRETCKLKHKERKPHTDSNEVQEREGEGKIHKHRDLCAHTQIRAKTHCVSIHTATNTHRVLPIQR